MRDRQAVHPSHCGTTDELLKNILEQSGLKCGLDFLLAFSPEREDPGNRHFNTASIPKVVGGVDDDAAEVAVAMYRMAFEQVVRVKSATKPFGFMKFSPGPGLGGH
jgi:UDP-N-acetyl-D-glucosamine dehydrogenase